MTIPIFTNNALRKMSQWNLSENQVLDVFNTGSVEKWEMGSKSIKKYNSYEIGITWIQDNRGTYKITSVWKRDRR